MSTLANSTRRKCFISYHHADEEEVEQFIRTFDHNQDILIARGIGASMPGDIINSTNSAYIMSQIRAIAKIQRDDFRSRYLNFFEATKDSNASQVSSKKALCLLLMEFLPSFQTFSMGFLSGL